MPRLLFVYVMPAVLINLGNVFAYLFQLTVARTLPVADVGAFGAIFAMTNVISAPAAILPFVMSRTIIKTQDIRGAAESIIVRSAIGTVIFTLTVMSVGWLFIGQIGKLLQIEHGSTIALGLLLICTNVQYCLAVGWLQGKLRYMLSSMALSTVPAMRCFFGLWLLVWLGGGLNSAVAATAIPGTLLFVSCFIAIYEQMDHKPARLPTGIWRDFTRFLLSSSISSLLLLGFWNLDIVTVRSVFSPEMSGFYSVAAVLGRIPYLLSAAVVNVLFSEATRASIAGGNSEHAARRVLLINLALAAALGLVAAIPLSLFAEQIVVLFGGPSYLPSAPILRILSFAMASLAFLQVIVTYMMARDQYHVLWILAVGLTIFLSLGRFYASSPIDIVLYLAATLVVMIAICLVLVFRTPAQKIALATAEGSAAKPGTAS